MRLLLAFACLVGLAATAHAVPCAESIGRGSIDVTRIDTSVSGLGLSASRFVTHPGAIEIVDGSFSPTITRVRIQYMPRPRQHWREVWTTPDRLVVCTPDVTSSMVVTVTGFTTGGAASSKLIGEANPEGYVRPRYATFTPPVSPLLAIMTAAGMLLSILVLVVYAVGRRERISVPAARARFRGVETPTLTNTRGSLR